VAEAYNHGSNNVLRALEIRSEATKALAMIAATQLESTHECERAERRESAEALKLQREHEIALIHARKSFMT
jgi:hypothetical protein